MTGRGSPVRRLARTAIRRALAIRHTAAIRRQGRVEAEVATDGRRHPTPQPPLGVFVDGQAVSHALDPTLRDHLKPAWRTMCDPEAAARPPTDEVLREGAKKADARVAEAERILQLVARATAAGRILEVGCYDGAVSFALAKRASTEVVASDLARYYVVQRPGHPVDAAVAAEEQALARLRERARAIAGVAPGRVAFVEDDITASALDAGSFDLIVSFEVLEHVRRPREAFTAMAALLRPGGLMYHEYNPFFAVNGGHSLVTLDLPWGHVRLQPADVARYLDEIRPAEAQQARRFYDESLNRMTLAELREAVDGAGLELLALLPWLDRPQLSRLDRQVLDEARRAYPRVTIEDLLATFVTLVARRPERAP